MADYAELVRCIRDCWDTSIGERVGDVTVCHCDECLFKDYIEEHDGWTDYTPCETRMVLAAADAIEELSMKLHGDEAAIAGMKREIERMVVNGTPRWIPVTERLPEDAYPVLVTYLGYNDKLPRSDMVAMYEEGDWYWYDDESKCKVIVTHWMPLPEPPKEKEE